LSCYIHLLYQNYRTQLLSIFGLRAIEEAWSFILFYNRRGIELIREIVEDAKGGLGGKGCVESNQTWMEICSVDDDISQLQFLVDLASWFDFYFLVAYIVQLFIYEWTCLARGRGMMGIKFWVKHVGVEELFLFWLWYSHTFGIGYKVRSKQCMCGKNRKQIEYNESIDIRLS